MKSYLHKLKIISLIAIFVGGLLPVANANWVYEGAPGFSSGGVGSPCIVVDTNGTSYVAFEDGGNNNRICVMKYNGASWDTVGATGISAGGANTLSLTIDKNGKLYLAYLDWAYSQNVTVKKFDGTNWVTLDGNPYINTGVSYAVSITTDGNGVPYIAYNVNENPLGVFLNVQKFNGVNWVQVGAPNISDSDADYLSIAIDNSNVPYVGYQDSKHAFKGTVKKFDGTNWVQVGAPTFTPGEADYTTIATDNSGAPYLSYSDATNNGAASVMKFDGTNWVQVGAAGISPGYSAYNELAFDHAGNAWLVYMDWSVNYGTTVMKFDGSNWSSYGCAGITGNTATQATLAFDKNNVPYVALNDYSFTNKATVLTYIQSTVSIQTQPVNQSVCGLYSNTTLSVSSSNGKTYQWQENDGTGFVNMTEGYPREGTTTNSVNLFYPAYYGMNGHTYRCIVGGCTPDLPDTSTSATVTAVDYPAFDQSPANAFVCGHGSNAQFSATCSDSTVTWQWQYFDVNNSSWINLNNNSTFSGTNESTLAITGVNDTLNGATFSCIIATPSGCSTNATTTLTINSVDTITINSQPADQVYCNYSSYTQFDASSLNASTYQWQQDNGSGFTNLSDAWPVFGSQTSSLALYYPLDYGMNGYKYRCIMGGGTCSIADTSVTASFIVHGVVTQSASDVTLCGADSVARFAVATSDTGVTYQWQLYDNNLSNWVNLTDSAVYSGTATATLNINGAKASMNANNYNCYIVSPFSCNTNSQATLYVDATPQITANASSTKVCAGSEVTLWGANGYGFTWNNGVTDDVAFTPHVNGIYIVTGYDNNGCPASDSIMLDTTSNHVPVPYITANGPASFCQGGSVTLTANNTSTSFNWYDNEVTPTINVTASAAVTVTNTDSLGCFRTSLPFNVYVPNLPVAVVNQQADCSGNAFSMSAGNTYNIPVDLDPANDCSDGIYIDGFSFAGINNQSSGCSAGATQAYSFYSSIAATVTQGAKYVFTITPPSGETNSLTYAIWMDFNNNGSFDDPNEMVYTMANTNYDWSSQTISDTITIPLNTGSCFTRMRIRTSENSDFWAQDADRADYGETEDYMIKIGSGAPFVYSWTSNPAGFTSNQQFPAANIYADTTYMLTVTDNATGCSKTTSVTVDSSSLMPAAYGNFTWNVYAYNGNNGIASDPQIDLDTYAGYYIEPTLNFRSWDRWDVSSSPSFATGYKGCTVNDDSHSVQYKRKGFTPGVYSIDVADHQDWCYLYVNDSLVFEHDGCCDSHNNVWSGPLDSTSKINFTWINFGGASHGGLNVNLVYSIPSTSTVIANTPICKGASGVTYSVDPILGTDYYLWSVPNGATILSGDSTSSIIVNYAANVDSGTVSVVGVNVYGTGAPSTFKVNIDHPDATIQASGSTTFCIGSSVSLQAPANGSDLLFVDNGSDRWVSIPFSSPLTNYTYEISFKTSDTNAQLSSVHTPDRGGDVDRQLWLSNGDIYHFLGNGETINSSGLNLADNQWHHVAVVVESGVGQRIYVDGSVVATGVKDASDFYWNNTLDIGWNNGPFTGEIDNVRLWNVVLTQNQIQQYMNMDVNSGGSVSGLIGNWKFNEGAGTSAINNVTGLPGTLHNVSWNAKNANSYIWSTSETIQSISVSTASNYNVIVTNSEGCTAVSTPTTVTVNNLPTVTVDSASVGVCHAVMALTNGSPSGGTYSGSGVTGNQFDPSIGAGSYMISYSYTDGNGCSNIDSSTMKVTAVPSVTSTTPSNRCDAGTETLGGAASAGSVSWYAASSGGSNLGTGTSFTTPAISNSTTYYAEADYNGCASSRMAVTAIVNHSDSTTQNVDLCAGGSVTVGVHIYSSSGNYTDIFTAANGCDSTIKTNLTVNPAVDVSTSQNGNTITANAASAFYQWIDCNNGNAAISNQTGQSFTATSNGSYAVIVTESNCSDTSSCVNINTVGINEVGQLTDYSIAVYPNPNNGVFNIKAKGEVVYSIINEVGQVVTRGMLTASNNFTVDISDLSSGIYFVIGYSSHATTKQKIVVEK